MEQIASLTKVVMLALLASVSQGVTTYDTGAGIVYRLGMTQDVTLERGTTNFNYLEYLIVAKHPGFPNKRSLVQFENLPGSCPTEEIQSAKMYLHYEYAHKASWYSVTQAPFIPRYLQVHLVKKSWNEAQATSTWRLSNTKWSSAWLGLDGTDAEAAPQQGTVTIFPERPKGFIEFDVTNAVKSWSGGVANNGLVIRATNELNLGRDIRFASNAMSDSSKHAYVLVRCASVVEKNVNPHPSSRTLSHGSLNNPSAMPDQTSSPSNRKAVKPTELPQIHDNVYQKSLVVFILGLTFLVGSVCVLALLGVCVYFRIIPVRFLYRQITPGPESHNY